MGVNGGSWDELKFIHVNDRPENGVAKKTFCIGCKAVMFETIGTPLKLGPCGMIECSKLYSRSAAVPLGTAKGMGSLKPAEVKIFFIEPAAENMSGDSAIHPVDSLKTSNGKTIDMINTDAEVRLCL